MATDWPPQKKQGLPPGYPLAAVDSTGCAIAVGSKVRIESVASCASGMPKEDQMRLRSYVGQDFEVLEIDRYGMVWFGADGGGASFSLKPAEVAVTA
jgi:streptogramin lyase